MRERRRAYRRLAVIAVLTGALSFLAAGCGGDDDDGDSAGGAGTTAAETTAADNLPQSIGKGEGRVDDVSYVGMVTRYVVELDRGGELQVVRQNLEMSSQEALEQRGRRVRVGWHAEHAYAIPDSQEDIPEEGPS